MRRKRLDQKVVDIVTPLVGSKFVKTLRDGLEEQYKVKVFRRHTPKRLPGGRVREHFAITPSPLDKIQQFTRFTNAQVSCPAWTTDATQVGELGSKTVFARTLINSTNGRGIVEFEVGDQPPPRSPLYVAYVPKKAEYRFHVFNGEVIDVQQKKKKRELERDRNTRVRNLNNGYVYCRDNVVPPAGADRLAIQAVQALGYRYGAVDLIYNEKRNQCYVLEVNSRPGLMGTTLDKYVSAIGRSLNLEQK